jgi:hypothetical protein
MFDSIRKFDEFYVINKKSIGGYMFLYLIMMISTLISSLASCEFFMISMSELIFKQG